MNEIATTNGAAPAIPDIAAIMGAEHKAVQKQADPLAGLWLDLGADIPEPQPLLTQGDTNVCTRGNFSCVVGPAKSRKTYLISGMVGAFLTNEDEFLGLSGAIDDGSVLYIDTEQGVPHVQRVIRRIHRIAGFDPRKNHERLRVLCLRELEPKKRIEAVKKAMERVRPTFCVIDGVGDLMDDTNSNTEAVAIATLLLQLTSRYECHILTAIHSNPGTDKARGHIGSEILRKAETVITVKKDGDTTSVTAAYCRDIEFAEFAFRIGADGLPELTTMPVVTPKNAALEALFAEIIPLQSTMTYADLVVKIKEAEGVQDRQAKNKIKAALDAGIIVKNIAGAYHIRLKTTSDETLPF